MFIAYVFTTEILLGQPKYVEVWIEKQAMHSTFENILEGYQVGIQSSKGFNSISMLYQAAIRLRRIKYKQNREIVILYFGDLDPSGDAMDEDIRDKLDHFGLFHQYTFIRVGVKPEHVQEYDLPEDPDEDTAARLNENDTRTRGFIRKYGKLYAIELDALAGKEPEAFKQLVIDAVEDHFDNEIWVEVKRQYAEAKVKRKLRKRIKQDILPLIASTTTGKTTAAATRATAAASKKKARKKER